MLCIFLFLWGFLEKRVFSRKSRLKFGQTNFFSNRLKHRPSTSTCVSRLRCVSLFSCFNMYWFFFSVSEGNCIRHPYLSKFTIACLNAKSSVCLLNTVITQARIWPVLFSRGCRLAHCNRKLPMSSFVTWFVVKSCYAEHRWIENGVEAMLKLEKRTS